MSASLHEQLSGLAQTHGPGFFRRQVPGCIYRNLKPGFSVRPYQEEAFGRFAYYFDNDGGQTKKEPMQLLFHMATGSGKTLVMAGLILYLYEKGYRRFLFFVNSTNIIEKTRDNFLNPLSSKYLFADRITIGDRQIQVKEADNFEATNDEDIHLVFSTIQGLHSRLNTPRENSLTYEDFADQRIVFISDEAHHINTETKKGSELSNEEREEMASWEATVNRLVQAHADNVLLEFTATADLANPLIAGKYRARLLFDYPLRAFRMDGYSKEVKVLQADLNPWQRTLQAVVLSQYRRKVFEKYGKAVKPVILFKSRRIKESQAFYDQFVSGVQSLQAFELVAIQYGSNNAIVQKAFAFFEASGITMENLVLELQADFSEDKLVAVNSKEESEEKQLAINSLEDAQNPYRVVFAVDKLNEGWDVLNLFDIVRLYDTRDAKNGKPGTTTIAEAQLIGRGARYCPFFFADGLSRDRRKFDEEPDHALRIGEELYYHSAYNPKYIQELNVALEEIGIRANEEELGARRIKKGSDASAASNAGHANDWDGPGLPQAVLQRTYAVRLHTGHSQVGLLSAGQGNDLNLQSRNYRLIDFGIHVVRKAINRLPFYQFDNLKRHLPHLASVSEFMTSHLYLGGLWVTVSGLPEQLASLSQEAKLEVVIRVLKTVIDSLEETESMKNNGFALMGPSYGING